VSGNPAVKTTNILWSNCMTVTVKDLIEAFQGFDENTPVVVTFRDGVVEHLDISGIYENKKVLEIEVGDNVP